MKHFLEVDDLTIDELGAVLDQAVAPDPARVLAGLGMALLFEKPSARTRNSMEMAVVQLGGHPLTIRADEVSLDVRESVEDVTRTLACYHAAIGEVPDGWYDDDGELKALHRTADGRLEHRAFIRMHIRHP